MTLPSTEEARPDIDPRLRARRQELRRREGRRRLRRLVAVLSVGGGVLGIWAVSLSPLLDVDRLVVRGATRSGATAVEVATGIARGEAMASLDLEAAGRAVERVPWVAAATVERQWPGTVLVKVSERTPVALVGAQEGRWVVVDARGRQLTVVEGDDIASLDDMAGLPRIEGLAPIASAGEELGAGAAGALQLSQRLAAAGLSPAPRVEVRPDGALDALIELAGGGDVRVRFGRSERLADKVVALATLLAELDDRPGSVVLDVRVPEAPVLTRGAT